MSDVFISYKREDEARVGRLVQALEHEGFSIWWDRSLAGGDSWRRQIEEALNAAKCVIVVWTHASVAPAGEFVRDEARRAQSRGVLVPVLLDKVVPPLGFGELQFIDLTHWQRRRRDPFFKDLCGAVQATLDGLERPGARGPIERLKKRLLYSSLGSMLGIAGLAFGFNFLSVQDRLCSVPIFQPIVSDMCGALQFGNRPTKTERLAWAALEPGNCNDLRDHVAAFPNGVYSDDAVNMIAARQVTRVENWIPSERRLALFVGQGETASETEAEARAEALGRGTVHAERLCKGFTATLSFRLISVEAEPQVWNCETSGSGVVCGFEGEAICQVEERRIQEEETCGGWARSPD